MTPEQEYKLTQGTVVGEIRHEVYSKYGIDAYKTAQYGWLNIHPSQNILKSYTLVNSSPIQFLVATVTYPMIDISIKESGSAEPPMFIPDTKNPINLRLQWKDANIPFLSKEEVDKLGTQYTLP